jgi:hypothetical protein
MTLKDIFLKELEAKSTEENNNGKHVERPTVDFSAAMKEDNTHEQPIMSHNHALWNSDHRVILGKLPSKSRCEHMEYNKRVNRYLFFQEKRIKQAVASGN